MILEIDSSILKTLDLSDQIKNQLVAKFGLDNVYDRVQMQEKYSVLSFCAPYVTVERKADGTKGTLEFSHMPRFYFNFVAD